MKKKPSVKQIAAMTAVILLAALYILTLIMAIVDPSASGRWFVICLVCTMAIPLLAWIFIWIYGETTGKKTIADLHLMQEQDAEESLPEEKKEESNEKPVKEENGE